MPKDGEKHVLLCKVCEKHVSASTVGGYSFVHDEIGEPFRFALHRCPSCSEPILTLQEHDEQRGWGDPTILYPEQYKQLGLDVPGTIRSSYDEAVKGFMARTYTASALMCRRTLEALVAEKVSKNAPLGKGIQELKACGLIDSHIYEWAEMLRVSGNKAAHDVGKNVSKQDAQDLIEFCHALIEYIFTYKERFEKFKRRARRL